MNSLQHLTVVILLKQLKTREFWKNTNVSGFKRQKIVRMHKTCHTSQFVFIGQIFHWPEGKHAISRV